MVKKESAGLFLQNGRNEKNTTLYIKSVTEGIKTLSDWDFAANSMQCSNKERFESDFSNSVFDYSWRAEKILIADDLAAISYPEYTDVNKFAIQNTLTGLYAAVYYNYFSYNSVNENSITKFILPRLNKTLGGITDSSGSIIEHKNINLESLFIVVEYDGYVTDQVTGGITYIPEMNGEVEVFEYSPSQDPVGDTVKSYYNFSADIDYPILHSRFFETYGKKTTSALSTGLYDPRLVNSDISIDIQRLPVIKQQISNAKGIPSNNIQFCFIGCKRVTFFKYTPVVKCGRVDLYKKLSGRITSLLSNGRAVSNNHSLIDGNAIRINGARNINGKDVNLNGIKYIQVVDNNTIDLYDDPGMTQKTFTISGRNPDADWIAVGNVYSETLPEGWQYVKTLTSPMGRNGYLDSLNKINTGTVYETPNISGQKLQSPMQKAPKSVINDYYFLLLYDIYGVDASVSYPANIKSILANKDPLTGNNLFTITPHVSSLNTLWASESAFIQECLFGADMDLKTAPDGSIYLAIGERGPQAPQNTAEYKDGVVMPFLYPHYSPYGKVHLLKLEKTASGILDSYVKTISAFDNDTSVLTPEHISDYGKSAKIKDFYQTNNTSLRRSQFVAGKNSITSAFLYNDYWYGSLLYHMQNYSHNQSFQTIFYPGGLVYNKNANGGYPFSSLYFSNFGLPVFDFGADPENPFSGTKILIAPHEIYPFIDSFGKSVALDIDGINISIATSSKTKTFLQAPYAITEVPIGLPNPQGYDSRIRPDLIKRPYPQEYSNLDCGYVHTYKLSSNVLTKYNKISNRSNDSYSGSIDTITDKAEKYAKTIHFYNKKIYFGSSRASEFYDKRSQRLNGQNPGQVYDYPISYNDISKIYAYGLSGASYVLNETIPNEANDTRFYTFNSGKQYAIQFYNNTDVKAKTLNNKSAPDNLRLSKYTYVTGDSVLDYTTVDLDCIVFPSDRFGDSFKVYADTLCSNSLDWYNESGSLHTDYNTFLNDPRLKSDYLHIYNNIKKSWTYISKISPSFDSIDSRYISVGESCDDTLLRDLGNYNYSNKLFNSKTWDYDLSKSYAIIDERIILRDPVSYSIFRKSPELNQSTGFSSEVKTDSYPYFKFDEVFYARNNPGLFNQSCDFYHTKYGSLFKYNISSVIENTNDENTRETKLTTPVFFFSIPSNSGDTINTSAVMTVSVQSPTGSFPKSLALKLYKKDPRTEVEASYKDNFTYNCSQSDPDLLYSDSDPSGEVVFSNGSLSKNASEIIKSSSYTDAGTVRTYTFRISSNTLKEYTLVGSQLKSSTLISNGESLVLADTTRNTYNATIAINNTLLIGLMVENEGYSIPPTEISTLLYSVTNYKLEVYSKKLSGSYYDSRSYSCCYDKVIEYHVSSTDNYCDLNKNRTLNPVLGAGISKSVATNCNSYGDISQSIQILSTDNIFKELSTSNIYGENFSLTKSFDLNQLKFLPLYIASNFKSSNNVNLNITIGYPISSNTSLSVGGSVLIDNSTSLFLGPSTYNKNISLFQKVPNFVPDPPSGTKASNIPLTLVASRSIGTESSNSAIIALKSVDSASTSDLFILGPVSINNNASLVLPKAHTYVGVSTCDSPSLFTFGSYKQNLDINLHIDGNKPEAINLFINGPQASINNANLFIDSKIQKLASQFGLVCYQKPNGNFTLFTSAPTTSSGASTLFTSYMPKGVNSINNGVLTSCNLVKNDSVFDISTFEKELLVYGTNSIVDKVYSSNIKDFGYRSALISLDKIVTDYEFYRFGRNQSLIHWNSNNMVIAYSDNNLPAFKVYSISGKTVELQKTVIPYTLDTGLFPGDSYVQDIKISPTGDIAISYYIEIKNVTGDITGGRFIVDIFNTSGVRINRHSREFAGFSEDMFLSNCMGLSLLFSNNKLFYTKESGYDTVVVKADSPSYNAYDGDSFFSNFLSSDKTIIENNIIKGLVPYNRSAFGHKIEATSSGEIVISAPLFNRYLLVAPTIPPSNNPDPINWVNIAWYNSSAYGTITSKQITGLTAPINLKIIENITSPEIDLYYRVTSTEITGSQLSIPSSPWVKISSSPGTTFSVSNNQWVSFCCYGTTVTPQQTVSVLNASNSDQVIDTFAIQVDK